MSWLKQKKKKADSSAQANTVIAQVVARSLRMVYVSIPIVPNFVGLFGLYMESWKF